LLGYFKGIFGGKKLITDLDEIWWNKIWNKCFGESLIKSSEVNGKFYKKDLYDGERILA